MKAHAFRLVIGMMLLMFITACQAPLPTADEAPAAAAEQDASDEEVTLTFTHLWEDSGETSVGYLIDQQLAAFTEANPNVTIDLEITSHDEYIDKFKVLAAGRELPDVFAINGDQITSVGGAGMLSDIGADLDANPAWRDLQVPGGMREWVRGDATYAVPNQMIITHVIYWNEDIFAEAGLDGFPATWEEFGETIVALQDAGYTPIAFGNVGKWVGYSPVFGTLSYRAHGVDWYEDLLNFEASFTDEEFVRGLEAFAEVAALGAFNADANSIDNLQQRTLYYNGEAAMFIEGDWAIPSIVAEAPAEIIDSTNVAVWPALPDGSSNPNEVTWAAGWGWGVDSELEGAEREAAISLLEFLSNEEYGRNRIEAGHLAAQQVTDFDSEKLSALSVELNELLATLDGVPLLTAAFPPSVTDVLGTGLQELMTDQTTAEELAAKLQEEYENYRP